MTAHPIKTQQGGRLKHAEVLGLGTRDYTLIQLCASSFDPGRFCGNAIAAGRTRSACVVGKSSAPAGATTQKAAPRVPPSCRREPVFPATEAVK